MEQGSLVLSPGVLKGAGTSSTPEVLQGVLGLSALPTSVYLRPKCQGHTAQPLMEVHTCADAHLSTPNTLSHLSGIHGPGPSTPKFHSVQQLSVAIYGRTVPGWGLPDAT